MNSQFSDYVLWGAGRGDRCGDSIAGGRDVDGDGLPDLVVGCPQDISWDSDDGVGKAYVVLAADLADGTTTSLEEAAVRLDGENPGDSVGSDVTLLPDTDGDGRAEAVVGLYPYNDDGPQGPGSFRTWLSGSLDGGGVLGVGGADVIVRSIAGSAFGSALASGDVDGDGLGDVLAGSSNGPSHLFLGSDLPGGGELDTTAATVSWTGGADLIPDFDGDGLDDVTVSGGAGLVPSQLGLSR